MHKIFFVRILACILLILVSPILLISIVLLLIESPGSSPFYRQKRVGFQGELFIMYKLRTMRECTKEEFEYLLKKNECKDVMFKIKKDPRITKVGYILRKFSIDEFPQLLNVVKGNMALVGPRPALVREVIQYSSYAAKRLDEIPGCSGLWQVSGRSNIDFEKMVELDLYYINNKSIFFDFVIMIKTVKAIISRNGAY